MDSVPHSAMVYLDQLDSETAFKGVTKKFNCNFAVFFVILRKHDINVLLTLKSCKNEMRIEMIESLSK